MATILVVDDEEANRELLRVLLVHDGHEVLAARNAADALDVLGDHDPDLLVVDLYMPDMNGTELIKRIRQDHGGAHRIAIYTGTQVDSLMRDFMSIMQISHIIPKPGEPGEIIAAIRKALDQ